jgi:Glycosyl hydrolases family 43
VGLVATLLVSGLSSASARVDRATTVGNQPFRPGTPYTGNFPDPTVLRMGKMFYAASTTIGSLSLPMMTSTNLSTWVPRPSSDPSKPNLNDAMPTGAAWARTKTTRTGRVFWPTWAPSLAHVGVGRYVVAYAVPRASDGRRCISVAQSGNPLGPYVDRTTAPLICGVRAAIDPQIFLDRGAVWLVYKWASTPDLLAVRRMTASGTAFAPGSRSFTLLAPRLPWEGNTVENPAMIRFHGRLYLFYSANRFDTAKYATGYAICTTVKGPCRRVGRLLSTGQYLAGQGGATPFVGVSGRLRLAYHAWRTGNVGYPSDDSCMSTSAGCPQRRLYVATLAAGKRGKLVILKRF